MLQNLIVVLIVLASFAYAAWALMPAAWRRRLAVRLLAVPGLRQSTVLLRAARPANACGCDGCDSPPVQTTAAKPIKIVRRAPR